MKHSPLDAKHKSLGAKMADFGGWEMPIEYPGGGVLAEHDAVRNRVGIFDVSHLGKISIKGPGAKDFINSVLTNDLNKISDGEAQYNLLCNENGGVIDDIIAYRNSEDDIFLVPNAANCAKVFAVLKAQAPANLEIVNLHEEYAVIAVQGPRSKELLESLGLNLNMEYMAFSHGQISGNEVIVCRTGYSGEHGYELLPKWNQAANVWDVLVSKLGDGLVCGLGARDTLRTEMGYPLHGNELSESISANVGGAAWAIAYDKASFNGDKSLRAEKEAGIARRLRGLKLKDRGIPRGHMSILVDGKVVGETTSGTFSPTLKVGIALGLVDTAYKIGDEVAIDVRGRTLMAEIVKLPMVPPHVK
ncbi:MAG: glycine cleavage system aminomethyltransferase GcvT [Candidatus Nanopelagicaceae bacterium]